MAEITLKSNPIHTLGELPQTGSNAKNFTLTSDSLEEISLESLKGSRLVLNIVPSIDTGVCAKSARTFNERATALENTKVLTISKDLPFALKRFCAAEGIDNVVMLSAFRSDFGKTYELEIIDGPMRGLLSRCVIVLDADHKVTYTEQVPEITQEPDYDAAVDALGRS